MGYFSYDPKVKYLRVLSHYRLRDEALPPVRVTRTVLSHPAGDFALPYEVVVYPGDTHVVHPPMGRYWQHRHFGFFPTRRDTKKERGFWTEGHSIGTLLIEQYQDTGDDGHVEYRLYGYVELMEDDGYAYVEYLRTGKRWQRDRLVELVYDDEWPLLERCRARFGDKAGFINDDYAVEREVDNG